MSYYPIELDKTRNLRYGMRAVSLVEKKFKKPMAKLDLGNLSMEDTAVLIWAGLAHEDKDLTSDRVMTLVDDYSNLTDVMEVVGKALNNGLGVKTIDSEVSEEKN